MNGLIVLISFAVLNAAGATAGVQCGDVLTAQQILSGQQEAPIVFGAPGGGEDFKGMSEQDVERFLGKPDERRGAGEGRESWLYGSSVILFRQGKVTAWSDAGELAGRKNMAQLQKGGSTGAMPSSALMWKNSWTPWQEVTALQIVDEVLSRGEKSAEQK